MVPKQGPNDYLDVTVIINGSDIKNQLPSDFKRPFEEVMERSVPL